MPWTVIEGYATIFAEADAELPTPPDAVVVPMGVGVLAAAVVQHYADRATIVVVEPLSAVCGWRSAEAGRPVDVPGPHDSIMAGLNCGMVSIVVWPTVSAGADVFVAIDDTAAERAMRDLAAIGVVVGETGAGVARGTARRGRSRGRRPRGQSASSCSAPRALPIPSRTSCSWGASREPLRRRRRAADATPESRNIDTECDAPGREPLGGRLCRTLERGEVRRAEVDDRRISPCGAAAAVDGERQHRRGPSMISGIDTASTVSRSWHGVSAPRRWGPNSR